MQKEKKAPDVEADQPSELVQVHMRLKIEQRDYIKRLATNRTINPSGGIGELFSRGLVLFFAARPYTAQGWEWKSPQSTYLMRVANPGWCAAHYILVDIEERKNRFDAKGILAMIKSVGATVSAERAQQQVLFSAVEWITTKLYPPHVYDIKHLPSRFQIAPEQLASLAKEMAKLNR